MKSRYTCFTSISVGDIHMLMIYIVASRQCITLALFSNDLARHTAVLAVFDKIVHQVLFWSSVGQLCCVDGTKIQRKPNQSSML